jgi:hypothetical protein
MTSTPTFFPRPRGVSRLGQHFIPERPLLPPPIGAGGKNLGIRLTITCVSIGGGPHMMLQRRSRRGGRDGRKAVADRPRFW